LYLQDVDDECQEVAEEEDDDHAEEHHSQAHLSLLVSGAALKGQFTKVFSLNIAVP
jgi:hypothetical protein